MAILLHMKKFARGVCKQVTMASLNFFRTVEADTSTEPNYRYR